MSRVFKRLRDFLVILLMLGLAGQAQFIARSSSNHRVAIAGRGRAKPVTFLALGDSTCVGVGASHGHGYVERLMTLVEKKRPGSRLVKLCRLGETTAALRERVAAGLAVKPTFVTLSIGANDILQQVSDEQFATNYEELVKSLKTLAAPIVVTNLPDFAAAPRLPNSLREATRTRILRFNKRIEALAKRYGLLVVDLYRAGGKSAKHKTLFSADGFHPSDAGYDLWTRIMWPTVKTAIERSVKGI